MNSVLSYASFGIAVAALVVASQSAVGEKPTEFAGTQVAQVSSEPAITAAWVYYPAQFVNKARHAEVLPAQF
ncbi:MAG: hypothetical protein ACREV0_06640 [Burkholderiales bacterium]